MFLPQRKALKAAYNKLKISKNKNQDKQNKITDADQRRGQKQQKP